MSLCGTWRSYHAQATKPSLWLSISQVHRSSNFSTIYFYLLQVEWFIKVLQRILQHTFQVWASTVLSLTIPLTISCLSCIMSLRLMFRTTLFTSKTMIKDWCQYLKEQSKPQLQEVTKNVWFKHLNAIT